MRIIFDVKFFPVPASPVHYNFLFDAMIEMAQRHSRDEFIFLTNKPVKANPAHAANVSTRYIKKGTLKWPGQKWWYRHVLDKILKELQPAIYIALDNTNFKTVGTTACLFMIELNKFMEPSPGLNGLSVTNKRFKKSLSEVSAIISFSSRSQELLREQLGESHKRLKLLKPGLSNRLDPLSWTEKESIKVQYALGCEYFVFAGDLNQTDNLLILLRAFSQFKKWQQSNMQLLLVGPKPAWNDEFLDKMATFKYHDEVQVIRKSSNAVLESVIGAAYALVYVVSADYFPVNVLRAMNMGVPVIAPALPAIVEMAGPAVIYAEAGNEAGFAKCMQDLYKDENSRYRLIAAANTQISLSARYDMIEDCHDFLEATFTSKSY